jgi:hypothetical protein
MGGTQHVNSKRRKSCTGVALLTNIAQANKLQLPVHLTNIKSSAYEKFIEYTMNKFNDISYENKIKLTNS